MVNETFMVAYTQNFTSEHNLEVHCAHELSMPRLPSEILTEE